VEVTLLFLGVGFLSASVGLAFAEVDKKQLRRYIHAMPGLALFRFAAFRWGGVIVLAALGCFCMLTGIGYLPT
jgi:hypothetical protein